MANLKIFYENEHGVITTIANKVEQVSTFKPYKHVYTTAQQIQ